MRDGGRPLTDALRQSLRTLGFPTALIEHDGPAEGAARARNRGVERARGEAIAFLDDDDLWEPVHVARLSAALERDENVDAVYSDARILHEADGQSRLLARDFDLKVFTRDGFIPPSALLARRVAFARFGAFDPAFTYSEDWEWLVRVAKRGGVIVRVPGATATIRVHAGSQSALDPERLAERQRCLDLLSARHGLRPITPKTFWEVAEELCPGPSAATS